MSDELAFLRRAVAEGRLTRREFLGRAAALGAGAAFATMPGNAAQAQTPQKGGDLKLGLVGGASTDSLDPALHTAQVQSNFGFTWGELLVEDSVEGSVKPVLAESWEASKDAATWTFKIRKGVTFHNGKDLTPEDVAQTIRRHSDAKSKSAALSVLGDLDEVVVDGDYVVFKLKRGNADMPAVLTTYQLIIQPNGGFDDPTAGIGTGPYRIEQNEPGVRHRSVKYDGYWRDDVGHVDSVEIIVMNDAAARIAALRSGQVHIINQVAPKTVAFLKNAPGVVIVNSPSKGHYLFPMFSNTAPFDNADLRMALKLAIDREQMVQLILQGYASVGNDFPINRFYDLFPEDLPQRSYDPDKAAFHYKKSGHSGPIVLRTSEVAFPGAVEAAQLYQQHAAKAGITLDVKREPGDGYWNQVWNVQPFCASYWGGTPTQNAMYSTAYMIGSTWNDSRFFNEKFDNLILAARGELDRAKRAEFYREAALIVRDEGGVVLPVFNDFIEAHRDEVQGWVREANSEMSNFRAAIRVWLRQS